MTSLYVGDPHATPTELDDCGRLIDYVKAVAKEHKPNNVVFLGDQHHTHSIVHLEVMDFWDRAFRGLVKDVGNRSRIIGVVGNHDQAGEGSLINAMMVYRKTIMVVEEPIELDSILYVPFLMDTEKFIEICNDPMYEAAGALVCHQTFDGSQYENGFYAKDGINPNLLPQKVIISGHIHTPQDFGKVWYPGSPRWRTLSDANVARNIWLVEHAADGSVLSRQGFDTGDVCRQIRYLTDTPEAPVQETLNPKHDWRVDIRGPAAWIEDRKAELAGPGVRIRTFSTDRATVKVKESEGIDVAFSRFLNSYNPRYGTDRAKLAELAKERLGVVTG